MLSQPDIGQEQRRVIKVRIDHDSRKIYLEVDSDKRPVRVKDIIKCLINPAITGLRHHSLGNRLILDDASTCLAQGRLITTYRYIIECPHVEIDFGNPPENTPYP